MYKGIDKKEFIKYYIEYKCHAICHVKRVQYSGNILRIIKLINVENWALY